MSAPSPALVVRRMEQLAAHLVDELRVMSCCERASERLRVMRVSIQVGSSLSASVCPSSLRPLPPLPSRMLLVWTISKPNSRARAAAALSSDT